MACHVTLSCWLACIFSEYTLDYKSVILQSYLVDVAAKYLYFVTGGSDGLNIVDIDKNNGDPQMCVTYVAEIYRNLMASEVC
jgi:hypothetical protein